MSSKKSSLRRNSSAEKDFSAQYTGEVAPALADALRAAEALPSNGSSDALTGTSASRGRLGNALRRLSTGVRRSSSQRASLGPIAEHALPSNRDALPSNRTVTTGRLGRRASDSARVGGSGSGDFAPGPKALDRLCLSQVAHQVVLHEVLGVGGSATVRRGTLYGLTFAVKEFDVRFLPAAERQCIADEAELLLALQHPSIARCFGYTLQPKRALVLFELFSCTLRDVLDERHRVLARGVQLRFDSIETCDALLQILRGLMHLHSQSPPILHRDIKSENMFVHKTGLVSLDKLVRSAAEAADVDDPSELPPLIVPRQIERVALADFGESTKLPDDEQVRMSANVGTPEFMAPEVAAERARDGAEYGPAVDMWSFGMLIYEMLTYEIPYRRDKVRGFALPAHIRAGHRPSLAVTDVPNSLQVLYVIFTRCTELDPSHRPSAKQLFTELLDLVQAVELEETRRRKQKEKQARAAEQSSVNGHENDDDDNDGSSSNSGSTNDDDDRRKAISGEMRLADEGKLFAARFQTALDLSTLAHVPKGVADIEFDEFGAVQTRFSLPAKKSSLNTSSRVLATSGRLTRAALKQADADDAKEESKEEIKR